MKLTNATQRAAYSAALVVISILAFFVALNWSHRTRVLTTDSIVYVDTARHIAGGQGSTTSLLSLDDATSPVPQTQWPPLYPMTMSPFIYFGMDAIQAGRVVSAVSLSLTTILIGLWSWRLGNRLLGMASGLLFIAIPGITSIAGAVLADSFYMLLVTTFGWLGYETILRPSRNKWIGLGLLVGFCILAKYLGLLLFGLIVVTGLWAIIQTKQTKKIIRGMLFSTCIALSFLAGLTIRNVLVDRPLAGAERSASSQAVLSILSDLWKTISNDTTSTLILRFLLILTSIAVAYFIIKKKNTTTIKPALYCFALVATYWLGLVVARGVIDTDNIYTRFTMPVYPLLFFGLMILVSDAAKRVSKKIDLLILSMLTIAIVVWTVKEYDFSAGRWQPSISQRTQILSELTKPGDLIVGDRAREYNLFLQSTVMHLSDDASAKKITPDVISQIAYRWHNKADRVILALGRNLAIGQYGQFASELSNNEFLQWAPIYVNDSIILYEITSR